MYWAHFRGLESEKAVIHFYSKKKFKLLKQRLKTPFAEIDLLFRSPEGHLLMVEVKSANQSCFYSARISKRQMQRLGRAASFLAARFNCLVEYHWAFVDQNYSVTVVEDVSL
ncbi:YraN family protein [Bdellovibrio svalbardensis]|uniref:YraN family protein n=1 Tax=Bdellovibrio svalbardensis TaxID=2972972 RepID=A0ABT6DI46_9BACT|nr:YraN family protein [Bdellovibrio svalbardensis]MDG0816521.1 YraN family protein [Bdellovibrio svalbardensis]